MTLTTPVFTDYRPRQAILVQSNPNMPKNWELGFGNRILPFIDAAARAKKWNLGAPVVSPFFVAAKDLEIFDGHNYLYTSKGAATEDLHKCFEHVFVLDSLATEEDYLDIFKKYSSAAIVETFPTHDRFDAANWKIAAHKFGVENRPGGIYRAFDYADSDRMEFTNACLKLKPHLVVEDLGLDEDCVKVCLFLRLGRYGQDTLPWVREEYPAKFFSDRDLGISSEDEGGEEFRMTPSLIVKTLEKILQEDEFRGKKLHMQITSDWLAEQQKLDEVADWFQNHFETEDIKVSFEPSPSLWRDLYGSKVLEKSEGADIMIGGCSDFLRIAVANNLKGSRGKDLHVYMPKPDVTKQKGFLQPNLEGMEHIKIRK